MKKMCNRVLAMLLTVVMMLSVLPLSVFASWVDVETENTQNGNTATSDIKVTVSSKSFLSYLKDGDIKGLLTGVTVEGLRDVVSVDEFFEIVPKEKLVELVDLIKDGVDPNVLIEHIDLEMLMDCVDMDALIALIKGIPNLENYIKEDGYDILMEYIDEEDIANAVEYLDIDALVDDYADELIDMALTLDADKLSKIVDVKAAMELDKVDFSSVLDVEFFESLDNYRDFIDTDALHDFVAKLYDDPNHKLDSDVIHHFIDDDKLAEILKQDKYFSHLDDYVDMDALQALIEARGIKYSDLRDKGILDAAEMIDYIEKCGITYTYLNDKGILDLDALFDLLEDKGVDYEYLRDNGFLDVEALFDMIENEGMDYAYLRDADILDTDALFDLVESLNLSYSDLVDGGLLNAEELFALVEDSNLGYTELKNKGVLDADALFDLIKNDSTITYGYLTDKGVLDTDKLFDLIKNSDYFTYDYLKAHGLKTDKLFDLIKGANFTYDELKAKGVLKTDKLFEVIESAGFAAFGMYIDPVAAEKYLVEVKYAHDLDALKPYYTLGVIDVEGLFNDGLLTVQEMIDNGILDATEALFDDPTKPFYFEKLVDAEILLPTDLIFEEGSPCYFETLIDKDILDPTDLIFDENSPCYIEKLVNAGIVDATALIFDETSPCYIEKLIDAGIINATALIFDDPSSPLYISNLADKGILNASKMLFDEDSELYVSKLADAGIIDVSAMLFDKNSPCYVDKLANEGILDVSAMLFDENSPCYVEALADAGILDATALIFDEESPCYINKLADEGIVKVDLIVSGDAPLFTIKELEENGVIDYKTVAFGDADKDIPALFEDIDVLIDGEVFDLDGMLHEWYDDEGVKHDPIFTFEDLIAEGVVLEDALLEQYSYADFVDIKALEEQLKALLENGDLTPNDVFNCLNKKNGKPDYQAAIDAIGGVEAVIANTDLTYAKIMTDYVKDFAGMMEAVGLEDIVSEIVADNKLEAVFDVNGLIEAIGTDRLMEVVDTQKLMKQLLTKEVIVDVLKSLPIDQYVEDLTAWTSDLINALSKNIHEIKLNGSTITEKPFSNVLILKSEGLLGAIQATVPTLGDLANMDADGTLMKFGFTITYSSDATDGVVKTKDIVVRFCLGEGVDTVRKLASKLESILGKFLSYNYNNGNVTLDFKVPSEFATVVRFVLTNLGTDADPELVKLKDELLGLYDANVSDLANFVDHITIGQIVTILEKVDSATFQKAYEKVLRQKYVALMVDFIAQATGKDLSGVPLNTLIAHLDDIPALPKLETIAQKIEGITGFDLVSKLPKRVQNVWMTVEGERVTDLLTRLAARAGQDFDFQELLEKGCAKEDPVGFVYDSLVEKIENSAYVYNVASYKVFTVIDRLMASKIGQKIDNVHLNEYYRGNGKFGAGVSYSFEPGAIIEKGIDKVVNAILNKTGINSDKVEGLVDILHAMISNEEVDVGLKASVTFKGLYKATFYNEQGKLLCSMFLPKHANLEVMFGEYVPTVEGKEFVGWKEFGGADAIIKSMPGRDIRLIADLKDYDEPIIPEDTYYTVTVVDPENIGNTKMTVSVLEGSKLSENAEFMAFADELLATLEPGYAIKWHVVTDGTPDFENAYSLESAVNGDLVLTWSVYDTTDEPDEPDEPDVYYDVLVKAYDENGEWLFDVTDSFLKGTALRRLIGSFNLTAQENHPTLADWEKALYHWTYNWTMADGTAIATDASLTANTELKVVIARDRDNAYLQLDGYNNYSISYLNGYYYLTYNDSVWAERMPFVFHMNFLNAAVANGDGLVLNTTDKVNGHKLSFNAVLLANMKAKMEALGLEDLYLIYALSEDNAQTGVYKFTFNFRAENNDESAAIPGDFFDNGIAEVRIPYDGETSAQVSTYLEIDGVAALLDEVRKNAFVTFKAPHFSDFEIGKMYLLSYEAPQWLIDIDLLGSLADVEQPANDPLVGAAGETVIGQKHKPGTVFTLVDSASYYDGVELVRTEVVGTSTVFAPNAEDGATFVMPASPVALKQVLDVKTYNVYYYVGNTVVNVEAFTKYKLPTDVLGYRPENLVGGTWFGFDGIDLATAPQDVYLFLTWEGVEKEFTMSFTVGEVSFALTHTVGEWLNTYLALLANDINAVLTASGITGAITWKSGDVDMNSFTMEDWASLMAANDSVSFVGSFESRTYTIYTDGNVTLASVNVKAGETVALTVIRQLGKAATVTVIKADGTPVDVTDNTFVMPDDDVTVKVAYTAVNYNYTDLSGNKVDALYGDTVKFDITLAPGKVLPSDIDVTKLDSAPAGLTLIGMKAGANNSVVLTFAFDVTEDTTTENTDLAAYATDLQAAIANTEYKNVYVVDGKYYSSIAAAEKALPEGVKITEWKQIDKNLFVAVLAYEEAQNVAGMIVLIVVLVLLLLILLVALIYTLHICGKIGPNWLTKAATAIVSVFFAACMAIAALGVKIARLFGYAEKDEVEDAPEAEEIPAEEKEAVEEATEETDAPAEEAEAAEQTAEEAAESVEEATEEAVTEESEATDAEETETNETNE